MSDKPIPIGNDYLNFKDKYSITSNLDSEEKIVFSIEVLKCNRFGKWQKRNLMLTTHMLCNIEGQKYKRNIRITNIRALTKSLDSGNFNDFIIHVFIRFFFNVGNSFFEILFVCVFEYSA